jgi:hypothetical protein
LDPMSRASRESAPRHDDALDSLGNCVLEDMF